MTIFIRFIFLSGIFLLAKLKQENAGEENMDR
jgi:hypothetical protein